MRNDQWIPVTKLPTERDANEKGYVITYLRKDRQWGWPTKVGFTKWNKVNRQRHTHWMHCPNAPANREGEQTLSREGAAAEESKS